MDNSNQLLKTQLMKVHSLYLSIPTPCHEDWDKMTPTEKGRHCQSCEKEVVDFSLLSDQQILDLFAKNKKGLCGRFRSDQLDRQMFLKPVGKSSPWVKAGLLAASVLLAVPTMGQQPEKAKIEQVEKQITNTKPGKQVTGRVLDTKGEPLIGASILVKSTASGTATDMEGFFKINLKTGRDTIVVSYTGFETKEVQIDNSLSESLEIQLEEGILLDEVVVLGYSTEVVKGGWVGAVSRIEVVPKKPRRRTPRFSIPLKPEIKVYPNPFVSQIQIELDRIQEGDYSVRLVANTGQVVHQVHLFLSSYQRLEFDIAPLNLPTGTYWLQISDGKEVNLKQQLVKGTP